jgi:hypothetical protein
MKISNITILIAVVALAGCGSAPNGGSAHSGPKTALTEEQFAEVKSNCHLEGATLTDANSSVTQTNPDGSTSTVTTTYTDGPPGQKTIKLASGTPEGAVAQAIICLNGEFERLGAEARVNPGIEVGF